MFHFERLGDDDDDDDDDVWLVFFMGSNNVKGYLEELWEMENVGIIR